VKINFIRLILLNLALGITLFVVWLIWQTQYLRPAGDDYCYGAITAEYGVLGGVVHWWNSWSGFIYAMFSGNLFVGFPLASLPLSTASAIPFVLTAFGISCTFILLQKNAVLNFYSIVQLIPMSMFCWWTFLWASPFINPKISFLVLFANGLTFWQTINGQYVLVIVILLIAFLIIRSKFINHKKQYAQTMLLVCLLGFIAGSAGTTLSLSILLVSICVFFWFGRIFLNQNSNQCRKVESRREMCFWGALFLFTLISMLFCHIFSPGSYIRTQAISPNLSLSLDRILHIFSSTFLEGIKIWLKSLFNYGAFAILILMTGIYFFYSKVRIIDSSEKKLFRTALFLLGFSLLQCLINRFSEEFTYQGYWHFVSPLVCTFLSLLLFGASLGLYLGKLQDKFLVKTLFCLMFLLCLWIGVSANLLMVKAINSRYITWIQGPALADGISDISDPNGWEMGCWNRLNGMRPSPTPRL